MSSIRLLAVMAFLLLTISPGHAQLGPKERANLKATDLDRVKVGDKGPDFTLENLDGKKISLSDFQGKKNIVLVFYRGRW